MHYKRTKKLALLILTALTIFITPSNKISAVSSNFYDTDEHWAENYIDTLYQLDIFKGDNGYANVDAQITRGEFTALTARTFLNLTDANQINFTDVTPDNIFFKEISAAYKSGLINGKSEKYFDVNSPITRQEAVLILYRTENIKNKTTSNSYTFKDVGKSHQYYKQISHLASLGIINGFDDGTFKPNSNITRAQTAKIILLSFNQSYQNSYKTSIMTAAENYIASQANTDGDLSLYLTGSAYNDYLLKQQTQNYVSSLGYTVGKKISDISVSVVSQSGSISELRVDYKISYTTYPNAKSNTYNAVSTLKTIEKDGAIKIFADETKLYLPQKINLTWEVETKAPSYHTDGVNVVSPPVFQLSKENLGVSGVKLGNSQITLFTAITNDYLNYASDGAYKIWPIYKTDFTAKTADTFLNNAEYMNIAKEKIIADTLKYGFDGINFDFENMYQKNKHLYASHVKDITIAMHEIGAQVSVDITVYNKTSSNWSMCFDRDSLSSKCDYLVLMAYDQYYDGSKTAGPVSAINWTEQCIKTTLSETKPESLILGMPFYMRLWEVKNNSVISSKAISMNTANKLISDNNASVNYDENYGLYKVSYTGANGNDYVFWLENADSIQKRCTLISKYSLAGSASWRRGFETDDIWQIIKNNM